MRQQRRLARDRAQQQMLQPAADDGVEDRVLAVRHRVDLHHVTVGALAVILRKLAERTFRLAHAGQEAALDHDLRLRRHPQFAGQAFDHRERPPVQRARDLELVDVDRGDRLRGEQRERIDADDDGAPRAAAAPAPPSRRTCGRGAAAAARRGGSVRSAGSGGSRRSACPVRGIARDHQPGGDVGRRCRARCAPEAAAAARDPPRDAPPPGPAPTPSRATASD